MSEGKKYAIGCSLAIIGGLAFCGLVNLNNGPGGWQFLTLAGIGLVILLAVLGLQKSAANAKEQNVAQLLGQEGAAQPQPEQQPVKVSQPKSSAFSPPCPYCGMPNGLPGATFCVTCHAPLPVLAQPREMEQEQEQTQDYPQRRRWTPDE